MERIKELQDFRKVLEEKIALSTKEDFRWQIDCYMRVFLNMLSKNWFGCQRASYIYGFPFSIIKQGSKIKLYGAGAVGRSFYQMIIESAYVKLIGWYDKNADAIESFCGESIHGLDELSIDNDEYILLAVNNYKLSEEIRSDLINRGIPNEKILWKEPSIIS